ncbi:hypothetical protein JZ751_003147 [Albula glossodonta]|uniref:Uncharacterized protein n=1 Tax=Albula glossodonta TaxID=121402 RepID=A0A8T2N8Z7_9TELE|nr:hypothetical protein JZ751_003147 [Albula glossodonta]
MKNGYEGHGGDISEWGGGVEDFAQWLRPAAAMTSTTDFDNVEITQQYSHINTRFELSDEELDNDNSSARLFERSRIKALAASERASAAPLAKRGARERERERGKDRERREEEKNKKTLERRKKEKK